MKKCILIPAYKPDEKLIGIINDLIEIKDDITDIVVIDDGSGKEFQPIFQNAEQLGCLVIRHQINKGKGAGIKTGLGYAKQQDYQAVVTADADGQHLAKDIIATLQTTVQNPNSLTLGVRNTKQMPLRSKFGNRLTTMLFFLLYGCWLSDTQTGLRGVPSKYYDKFSKLSGDRYEYEMNMLIYCVKNAIPFEKCIIDTVYIEENKSSHFRGIKDGLKIYALILKQVSVYTCTSLVSTLIDYIIFWVCLYGFSSKLIFAVLISRAISSLVNYYLNSKIVFKAKGDAKRKIKNMGKYYSTVGIIVVLNYLSIALLTKVLRFNTTFAKVITDAVLYILSFKLQQHFVFKTKK